MLLLVDTLTGSFISLKSCISPGVDSGVPFPWAIRVEERSSQWRKSTELLKSVEDPVKVEAIQLVEGIAVIGPDEMTFRDP